MTPLTHNWLQHNDLRLHYLTGNAGEAGRVPLVFVPGGLGAAEDYAQDTGAFAPRRCLAMSLRGQGRSDAPPAGYTLAHFVSDVAAVLTHSGLDRPCLMAYSMAVPVAVAYAAANPLALSGLILGDYPAEMRRLSPDWVDRAVASLGRLSQRHVMEAMQRESSDLSLWDQLPHISCPVLILRGGQGDARLSAAAAARYTAALPRARVVTFPLSGHALWEPDPSQFMTVLQVFLAELDSKLR